MTGGGQGAVEACAAGAAFREGGVVTVEGGSGNSKATASENLDYLTCLR